MKTKDLMRKIKEWNNKAIAKQREKIRGYNARKENS